MPSVMDDDGDRGEAELLVPWYVAGNLEEADAQLIEELALRDKEFARLIEEARLEAETIASLNEAERGPSSALWARIEKSLDQERRARPRLWLAKRAGGLIGRYFKLFRGAFGAAMAGPRSRRGGNMRCRGGRDCLSGGRRQRTCKVSCRVRPASGDKPKAFRLYRIVLGHGHHRGDRQGARRCGRGHGRRAECGYALPPWLAQ